MAKKDLTPKQKAFKKRYLDINDQFVSYKNVQDYFPKANNQQI